MVVSTRHRLLAAKMTGWQMARRPPHISKNTNYSLSKFTNRCYSKWLLTYSDNYNSFISDIGVSWCEMHSGILSFGDLRYRSGPYVTVQAKTKLMTTETSQWAFIQIILSYMWNLKPRASRRFDNQKQQENLTEWWLFPQYIQSNHSFLTDKLICI